MTIHIGDPVPPEAPACPHGYVLMFVTNGDDLAAAHPVSFCPACKVVDVVDREPQPVQLIIQARGEDVARFVPYPWVATCEAVVLGVVVRAEGALRVVPVEGP